MEWKDVFVFISSTFNDMHAERDLLLKKVFPELSEWCARRCIRLFDIDLRWGVTSEDSRAKNTVEVCLRNIDQCRPFFLCFLGQRRGWVPENDRINPDTLSHYPGLADHIGKRSVTEMEVEHALLAPMLRIVDGKSILPESSENSLFFLRDDSYLSSLNQEQKMIFTNEDAPDVTQTNKLHTAFIQKVRDRCRNVFDYHCVFDKTLSSSELREKGETLAQGRLTDFTINGQAMDRFILEALKKQILIAFPERCEEEKEEVRDSELLAQDRKTEDIQRGTVLRKELMHDLDCCFLKAANRPIYVYGEAGSGKSTLLSQFARENKPAFHHCCIRYCGATPSASRWADLWNTIRKEFGLKEDEEGKDTKDLYGVLNKISGLGKTLLIIDGVDELSEGLSVLSSVPAILPENIRLILSFRSDSAQASTFVDHLERTENTCICHVNTLKDKKEISDLINAYLQQYLKALDDEQIDAICMNPAATNPLYLKIILRELRIFGSRSQINRQLANYGKTPKNAFFKLLEDLEAEIAYNPISPSRFLPEMMGTLALVRGTIRISVLKKALVLLTGNEETAVSDTLAFYLRRLGPYLVTDGENAGISYRSFQEAASERYEQHKTQRHLALAEVYLSDAPLECLYHHRMAENWDMLNQLSKDFRFLCKGIQISGAWNLCAELQQAEEYVNTEVLACLQQTALLIGKDIQIAMPLFYKELSSTELRKQAASLCVAPWLRYEPIPAEPPTMTDTASFQTKTLSEHLKTQGFCFAKNENLAFFLFGESEIMAQKLDSGMMSEGFTLPCSGRIRKIVCSADGKYIAAACEDLALHVFRVTLDNSLHLLALTSIITDQCSSIRFGGICLFSQREGILWQRRDGSVIFFSSESEKIIEKAQTTDCLTGCFDNCSVWKSSGNYILSFDDRNISIPARVNDVLENEDLLYICAENKMLTVIDREKASVMKTYEFPESLISIVFCGNAVYGTDRYGCIYRINDRSIPETLGRITQGDNVVDVNTCLLTLNDNQISFVSLQRTCILCMGTILRKMKIFKANQGISGVHLLWSGESNFAAVFSNGVQYSALYPKRLLSGDVLNEKNNLKAACSENVLAYEENEKGLRFILPNGEKELADTGVSEMGGLICNLNFVLETRSFQATTYKSQFWEINEQGERIVQLDLPRSESNLYFLCPCGETSAVLSRRVRAWQASASSAMIIDVLTMIEKGRILWTKEVSRHKETLKGLLFDKKTKQLLLFYSTNHIEVIDPQTGSSVFQQEFPAVNFMNGAVVNDGIVFTVSSKEKESYLAAYALNGNWKCRLPSQNRIQQISEASEGILVVEGNEKLYHVCIETGVTKEEIKNGII